MSRLTAEELQEIRERAGQLADGSLGAAWIAKATKAGTEDVPRLLGELDRLRSLVEQAAEPMLGRLNEWARTESGDREVRQMAAGPLAVDTLYRLVAGWRSWSTKVDTDEPDQDAFDRVLELFDEAEEFLVDLTVDQAVQDPASPGGGEGR